MMIAGVNIKKGAMIVVSSGLGKYKSAYIDSRKFRPERFETEVPALQRYEHIPFYEGKRKCIGYNLALMNMRLLIGYTINKFELKVDDDLEIIMDIFLYKVKNPFIKIKLRN